MAQNTQTLDQFMRPLAITTGKVVTREIMEIIRKWANGEIGWNNKGDKGTLEIANNALASRAKWYFIETKRSNCQKLKSATPVTSVAQAKKLGLKQYSAPGFPKGYDPCAKVGKQSFTYGQLYAAWRGAFEQLVADTDDYPFVCDIRAAHNSFYNDVDCGIDEVKNIFESMAGLDDRISAMCVDFYACDNWSGQADAEKYGFHIEDGEIDHDHIAEEYLPAGCAPVDYKSTKAYRNELVESDETKNKIENYFKEIRRKAPVICICEEGVDTEGMGTTLTFRPKGHPDTLRLRLKENLKWQCDCIDPKNHSRVTEEGKEYDSVEDAVSDAVGLYETDIPLDVPGFTKENISKAKKLMKELTDHLKSSGLKLAFDLDDDQLFLVPEGTIWGSDETPKGYVEASGDVIEEMSDRATLSKKGDIVAIHLCNSCDDFDGELHYPSK